jgi:hypothetical protein
MECNGNQVAQKLIEKGIFLLESNYKPTKLQEIQKTQIV